MSIEFDEAYYTETGYSQYQDYPHFAKRAEWISENLSGNILEVGCGYGYLLHHLSLLGKENFGIDSSAYAEGQADTNVKARFEKIDIKDYSVATKFDWCVSWNVLDCLIDETDALAITTKIKTFATNQLHIICMSGQRYTDQGYFIKDYTYWRTLLPDTYLVDYETKAIYIPDGERVLSGVPLILKLVSD